MSPRPPLPCAHSPPDRNGRRRRRCCHRRRHCDCSSNLRQSPAISGTTSPDTSQSSSSLLTTTCCQESSSTFDHQVQALSEEAALRKELLKEASDHAELKRIAADFPLLRVLAFYMRTHKSNKNAHASVSVQIKSRCVYGETMFLGQSRPPQKIVSQKSTVNSSPFQPLEIPKNCRL